MPYQPLSNITRISLAKTNTEGSTAAGPDALSRIAEEVMKQKLLDLRTEDVSC